ncbi:hypothetical protein [Microbispora sp. NPDC049125]|uniref:hypothetical protein n=1 Tax=Microbispora sp. NPDC049125 TaxID=3154929 RepID=UPI0034676F61
MSVELVVLAVSLGQRGHWVWVAVVAIVAAMLWLGYFMISRTMTSLDGEIGQELRALVDRLPSDSFVDDGEVAFFVRPGRRSLKEVILTRRFLGDFADAASDLDGGAQVSTLSFEEFLISGHAPVVIERYQHADVVKRGPDGRLVRVAPDVRLGDLHRLFSFRLRTRAGLMSESEVRELVEQLRDALDS